jgi:hypothetical protein
MKYKLLLFCILGLFLTTDGFQAQDITPYKFGKITAADFNLPSLAFDSGMNAVIISDIGSSSFEGNNQGYFTIVFTHFLRIKILNKNGVDAGTREIQLYHRGGEESEKLFSIRGSTFNLESGIVQETKLDEKSIFEERLNKDYIEKKISMPALKEGSIYDLEYTIKSPYLFQLRSWSFQGKYPSLWSEYVATIPPPLHYVISMKGDQNFDMNTQKVIYKSYTIHEENGADKTASSNIFTVSGPSISRRWVKKNISALHEEPYTTTLDNYYSSVSFQLKYIQWNEESDRHEQMSTWNQTAKELLEDEQFGIALDHENNWMSGELKTIIAGVGSEDEKTVRVFNYVQNNFKTTGDDGYSKNTIFTRNSLKDVFQKKQGNVAEINLLLTAMLRKAGIHAEPLILSTRDNGIATPVYPLIGQYNYVICIAYPGDKQITLDASDPFNGYGQLPVQCYNGYGHIMNETKPFAVEFNPDSIKETKLTSVRIFNDEKGKSLGSISMFMGKSESNDIRAEITRISLKKYEEKIQTLNELNLNVQNLGVDSLKQNNFPLNVHFDFGLKDRDADIVYFRPMLNEGYKTNPFNVTERHYPVEMPFRIDETYILAMDIPAGFQVDEIPKSARVLYNDDEGMFEYLIQKGNDDIQMRVKLILNKTFFPNDEYGILRDFFAFVVKKENEQIVFKKIK